MEKKLFSLENGDFSALFPFFQLYFLLFLMLSVADAVSLTLFVQRVGSNELPFYYGITAGLTFLLMPAYLAWGNKLSGLGMLQLLVASFAVMMLAIYFVLTLNSAPPLSAYGLLFAAREIAFTFILLHFGNFLQDYLSKAQMDRMMSLIYAGGRLGSLAGGVITGLVTGIIGAINLLIIGSVLGALALVGLFLFWKPSTKTLLNSNPPIQRQDFLQYLRHSSYLQWLLINTFVFIVCRWHLNLQYNQFFETHFTSENSMASFLGWYFAGASIVTVLIQLFAINRLVKAIGIGGCYWLYSMFVMGALGCTALGLNLGTALFVRFTENELRMSLRNPIAMLMTNRFSPSYRKWARAMSMGTVIPMATLFSSLLLVSASTWISPLFLSASLGLTHLGSSAATTRELAKVLANEDDD